jgi:hypothetical protein
MTTPIQHAPALPTAAQPAATTTKTSTEWQQFCDWFTHPITPGSGNRTGQVIDHDLGKRQG